MSEAKKANCAVVESRKTVTKDGALAVTIKVATDATADSRALSLLTGRDVAMTDGLGKGQSKWAGHVGPVTTKPHKERPTGVTATATIGGGPDLEKLVGRVLNIEALQESLPGTE